VCFYYLYLKIYIY